MMSKELIFGYKTTGYLMVAPTPPPIPLAPPCTSEGYRDLALGNRAARLLLV